MRLSALAKSIAAGLVGEAALREAVTTELGQVLSLVHAALKAQYPQRSLYPEALYADRIVVRVSEYSDTGANAAQRARYYAYPYTIADDNTVTFGEPSEVVMQHVPVTAPAASEPTTAAREAASAGAGAGSTATGLQPAGVEAGAFLEAVDAAAEKPSRFLVRVIRSGTSKNNVRYTDAVLREAAPLFNGARVFAKSDAEHIAGGGKDVRQLVGRLTEATFVPGAKPETGEIRAVLDALDSVPITGRIREAIARRMTDMFGLSIDVHGAFKRDGAVREAVKFTKVASVDVIVDPGAGGEFIRFVEATQQDQETPMNRHTKLALIALALGAAARTKLDGADDAAVDAAFREADQAIAANPQLLAGAPAAAATPATGGLTMEQVREALQSVELRALARGKIDASGLPKPARDRLHAQLAGIERVTEAAVDEAIKAERTYLAQVTEGAAIRGLGAIDAQPGEDRSQKVAAMFDDFFAGKNQLSFREAYIEVTGDRRVTGLLSNCDMGRLREAAGADFREAISSSTFNDILGDSVARAMIREYRGLEAYQDWQWLVDIVPVSDFRTQERTRMGGYGNLPTVAQAGAYTALTSPTDDKATYAVAKRGGIETITLETIANDDVGVIRRVPMALAVAAARTLYEFVYDFLATNPTIYDGLALFVAGHNNIGTTALSAASFAASRLRMKKQTELSSSKRLGVTLRHVAVPSDLEELAFDLFVRGTNQDETFVQSRKPIVHVVDYWTDTNNWFAAADKSQVPLIELGFYGSQEPEIFIADLPTQGSLFSNDQVSMKIRHTYGGAVQEFRGLDGNIVA